MGPEKPNQLPWLVACGIALAACWGLYAQSIAPLRQQEAKDRREAADLKERVEGARKKISEIRVLEQKAERASTELARLGDHLPAGSPMVWLPELVKGHFGRSAIEVPIIRLNTIQNEPDLEGYNRGYWSLAVPIGDQPHHVTDLLFAVASLEEAKAFPRVLDFAIRPDPENPAKRVGLLNIGVLIRK